MQVRHHESENTRIGYVKSAYSEENHKAYVIIYIYGTISYHKLYQACNILLHICCCPILHYKKSCKKISFSQRFHFGTPRSERQWQKRYAQWEKEELARLWLRFWKITVPLIWSNLLKGNEMALISDYFREVCGWWNIMIWAYRTKTSIVYSIYQSQCRTKIWRASFKDTCLLISLSKWRWNPKCVDLPGFFQQNIQRSSTHGGGLPWSCGASQVLLSKFWIRSFWAMKNTLVV